VSLVVAAYRSSVELTKHGRQNGQHIVAAFDQDKVVSLALDMILAHYKN
jgi:hypothetical protein